MTRLTELDIHPIPHGLSAYDRDLERITGRTLLGIACHACEANEAVIRNKAGACDICVVPVTAGLGIITDFSRTVADILVFLGFPARVTRASDVSGIAEAFETGANAVMMADDSRFVGIHTRTRQVADNSVATGMGFAAALDLMADGIKDRNALVIGCGPVGESAALRLLSFGARVSVFDIHADAAKTLTKKLNARPQKNPTVLIEPGLDKALQYHCHILEATPSSCTIPDDRILRHMKIAAPGVPLGLSDKAAQTLKNSLVHDKLEIGVAVMAVLLLCSENRR